MKHKKSSAEKSLPFERKPVIIHIVLIVLVLLILIARLFRGDFYSAFLCLLTLLLFNIPIIADRTLKIKLPGTLEIIILLFIFAAEILGELGSFYTKIPWWDTMLHTTNGFLMAAIGFSLIDVLNNHPKFHIKLSPLFVAVVAFCFSMTIGVLWEFFEFGADILLNKDMQKDSIINNIASTELNPDGINKEVRITNIEKTIIVYTENGEKKEFIIENGYLDVGIRDTMEDLIVNCIGAAVFSMIGYFYILGRNKGRFVAHFIPQMKTDDELIAENQFINEIKQRKYVKRKKE